MLTINLQGGLGNQLFQIVTLIAHSIKYKTNYLLEHKKSLPGQYVVRDVYWDNLFSMLKDKLVDKQQNNNLLLCNNLYNEPYFHYKEIPEFKSNTLLNGYFQSYKYFDNNKNEIFNLLKFNEMKEKLNKYKIDNMISLHFRVGDYTKLQAYHPLMIVDYYITALNCIVKKTNKNDWQVMYFCEEQDKMYVDEKINIIKNIIQK
jgi:hypothetical protein